MVQCFRELAIAAGTTNRRGGRRLRAGTEPIIIEKIPRRGLTNLSLFFNRCDLIIGGRGKGRVCDPVFRIGLPAADCRLIECQPREECDGLVEKLVDRCGFVEKFRLGIIEV